MNSLSYDHSDFFFLSDILFVCIKYKGGILTTTERVAFFTLKSNIRGIFLMTPDDQLVLAGGPHDLKVYHSKISLVSACLFFCDFT